MTKSFLKWAGGKSQSLDLILSSIGEVKGRFIEPFVGSGVVSLNVRAKEYIIGDNNTDLINLYKVLKNVPDFIERLKWYFSGKFNNAENFYEFRHIFNTSTSLEEKAMIFVYLNRHCFNGLCRYNSKGGFNVPFGKYKKVNLPEKELLFFKTKLSDCIMLDSDFEETMALAKPEDTVYGDPPYVPLSLTSSFTDYSVGGFSEQQQVKLAKLAENSICKVLISNHDTEFTRELYKNADEIKTKEVNRFISASSSGRKKVSELLAIYNKE